VKASLSKIHFRGAQLLADRAAALEPPDRPIADDTFLEHRALVTGAVLMAVAALEASINELYLEVVHDEPKTTEAMDGRALALIKQFWPDTERLPILEKYQRVLVLADRSPLPKGDKVYQAADHAIKLRDTLVHYKPEWHDEKGRHRWLEDRLRGKFPLNVVPPGVNLWFPHQCLSAGCAKWSIQVASDFMRAFCERLNVPMRF